MFFHQNLGCFDVQLLGVGIWCCFDIVLNVLPFLARLALFWFSCNLLPSLAAAAKLPSLHARTVTLSHPFCYTTSHSYTLTLSYRDLYFIQSHYHALAHYHTISNCNEVYYTPFCYTKCAGSGEFLLKVIPEWKNKAKILPFWSIRSTEPLSSFDAFP